MEQKLKQVLSRRQKNRISDPSRVPAAVLIPLYRKSGQYHILFIQRSNRVMSHKGEVSFPGGAYEEEDGSLLRTALREAAEEIGLAADDVEILGELDDFATVTSGYVISPFVAKIPSPYNFRVDGWETEEIIEVPLSALLGDGSHRLDWDIPESGWIHNSQYHYRGKTIWGATASILNQLLGILTDIVKDG